MNALLERFITPKMVTRYYDVPVFLSPLFLLLTAVFTVIVIKTVRLLHADFGALVVVLLPIVSVWIHLIWQHRWFRTGDSQTLRQNASRTTLAFSALYVVTVGILLSFIH